MTDEAALIVLKDLRRVYTTDTLETHALGGIDLDIQRGVGAAERASRRIHNLQPNAPDA